MPTIIGVPTTVLLNVFITETVLLPEFVTYMLPPVDAKASPEGALPTDIVLMTVLFVVVITETVLSAVLATYMLPLDDAKATPEGELPTIMVPTTMLVDELITETVPAPLLATYIFPFDAKATPVGVIPTDTVGKALRAETLKQMLENMINIINNDKIIPSDMRSLNLLFEFRLIFVFKKTSLPLWTKRAGNELRFILYIRLGE
jgi:hypothetical protein